MEITPNFFLQLGGGLALFAFGWTLFRLGIRAIGFLLGFLAGYSSYELLLEWLPKIDESLLEYIPTHPATSAVLGGVLGLVGLFMAMRLYPVLVFLGSLAGSLYVLYAPSQQDLARTHIDNLLAWLGILERLNMTFGNLWPALIALVVAAIFVYYQRQVIILITAAAGSLFIVQALNIKILFLPLCFIGYLLQQKTKFQKRPKRQKVDDHE